VSRDGRPVLSESLGLDVEGSLEGLGVQLRSAHIELGHGIGRTLRFGPQPLRFVRRPRLRDSRFLIELLAT
jgi:hypothetical protein